MTRMILGCMGWGGGWAPEPPDAQSWRDAEDVARHALHAALDAGITTLDTADIYAHGRSEETLGRLLGADPGLRETLRIQTKCGIRLGGSPLYGPSRGTGTTRYDSSPAHLRTAVAGSLERLQTDHVETLIIHRPDVLTDPVETVGAFLELKAAVASHRDNIESVGVVPFKDSKSPSTGLEWWSVSSPAARRPATACAPGT